jgi:hypothetical protein
VIEKEEAGFVQTQLPCHHDDFSCKRVPPTKPSEFPPKNEYISYCWSGHCVLRSCHLLQVHAQLMGAKQGSMPIATLAQSQSWGLLIRSARNSFSLRCEHEAHLGQSEGHSFSDAVLLYQGATIPEFSCEVQLFTVHESIVAMQHMEQPGSSGVLHPANALDEISSAASAEKH